MRIVMDLRSAHPGLTGIGRYAANLCLSLERSGADLELHALVSPTRSSILDACSSTHFHVIAEQELDWDHIRLPDLLQDLGAEVFHSPLFLLPSIEVCKYVCTVHDAIPVARPDLTSPSFASFFHSGMSRIANSHHKLVAVSDHARHDITTRMNILPERVTTIHEAISPIFRPKAKQGPPSLLSELRLPPSYVLFVGALDRRKNLPRLLQALRHLGDAYKLKPTMVIVGGPSGDGYAVSTDIRKHALERQVVVLGRVTDELLVELYAHASVFVFPSLYEGFGLPVVEAMASGTPVIASKTTSIPEVAGEAALLVDPEDHREISAAMAKVLSDPELAADLSRQGVSRAAEFSLEKHGSRLSEFYRRILGGAA